MKIVKIRMYTALIFSPFLVIHLLLYCFSSKKQIIKSDIGGGGV